MSGINAPGGFSTRAFGDPWDKPSKIVIGIDIGTTQSGVAFSFLQEGAKPFIHRVTQWPGQGHNSSAKIPTVLWYDSTNKAVSIGASALTRQIKISANINKWQLAKHFKLHLHPSRLIAEYGLELEPLPFTVPLKQIYSDFLGYLLECTKTYFEDHVKNGKEVWKTYEPTMEVVLAHPNGWGLREQAFLRSAAVKAGFASVNNAENRVHFVHEAEASVHYCTLDSDIGQLELGMTFAVCDAGGSTVDTTVYKVEGLNPIHLEEIRTPDCIQAGAIFIDKSAEEYLRTILRKTGLSQTRIDAYATHGVNDFELHSKRGFKDIGSDQYIEMAWMDYDDSTIRVRGGQLTLEGSRVKVFFDSCLYKILESVSSQIEGTSVSHILLVGGFGDSPFLREQLRLRFEPAGCNVMTPSQREGSKAVADGTIIWYSSNIVVKRVPSHSYGIEVLVPYNPQAQDHKRRMTIKWPTGLHVKGGWSQILHKGVPVDCDHITRRPYYREYTTPTPPLGNFTEEIWLHNFRDVPQWMRFKPGSLMPGFYQGCSVKADLSHLKSVLQARTSLKGVQYWSLSFNVCITFGRTAPRAFLEWEEEGVTRTSKAQLMSISALD